MGKHTRAHKHDLQALLPHVFRVIDGEAKLTSICNEEGIPSTKTMQKHIRSVRAQLANGIARSDVKLSATALGRPTTLTGEQETALAQYCSDRQSVGAALDRETLCARAGEIAKAGGKTRTYTKRSRMLRSQNGLPEKRVIVKFSRQWFKRFLLRRNHSGERWTSRKISAIDPARARNVNRDQLTILYDNLRTVMSEHNFGPHQMYNVDETGVEGDFNSSRRKRLVLHGAPHHWGLQTGLREHTSVVMCMSATGHVIPPLFIFKDRLNEDVLEKSHIPGATACWTDNAYVDSNVFSSWIDHFLQHSTGARPLLLIMDGHKSHLSSETIQKCKEKDIVLLLLPPHTSHVTQPADVAVFHPLKASYHAKVEDWKETVIAGKYGESKLRRAALSKLTMSRPKVVELFTQAIVECVTPANCIAGFRATGIFPLNPQVIRDEKCAPSTLLLDPQVGTAVQPPQITVNEILFGEDVIARGSAAAGKPVTKGQRRKNLFSTSLIVTRDDVLAALQKLSDDKNAPKATGGRRGRPRKSQQSATEGKSGTENIVNSSLEPARDTAKDQEQSIAGRTEAAISNPVEEFPEDDACSSEECDSSESDIEPPPAKAARSAPLLRPHGRPARIIKPVNKDIL